MKRLFECLRSAQLPAVVSPAKANLPPQLKGGFPCLIQPLDEIAFAMRWISDSTLLPSDIPITLARSRRHNRVFTRVRIRFTFGPVITTILPASCSSALTDTETP